MRTRYKIVLVVTVLCVCVLCSCRENPGGIVEDSNDFSSSLPCWDQSWECGGWEPLKLDSTESIRTWDAINAGDGTYLSICDNCRSIRILDFNSKKERIILAPRSHLRPSDYEWTAGLSESQLVLYGFDIIAGEHKWLAGLSLRSFDLIEAGDILAVQQRHYLFIFRIENISGSALDDQEVTYKVATFSLKDRWPIKIDLYKVKWKERKTHKALPIAGRDIEFHLFRTILTNSKPVFIEIFYDQYYGGLGGPDTVVGDDAAKIAIIHKDNMKEDGIIDFRRYRFKTWEDGLGNLCDETVSYDEAGRLLNFIDK
jgi:hypothetical protein